MEMLNFATRKRKVQKIGMKRSLNILMVLMLSLMVVYFCVKRSMHHDCCQGKLGAQVNKHCMKVEMVKLSPTVSIQHLDFDAVPVFAGIAPALWQTLPRPVICSIQKARYWNQNVPHSPPRAYLALLNFLII